MARIKSAHLRIGISGWTYAPWRGVFYPKDLPHARELSYVSRLMNSVEINGTFYSLQRPTSYQAWYAATPADFLFALKGGRYITHLRRLREVKVPLANFFASGPLDLKEKLGPILWQLPPNLRYDAEKLEAFFRLLPRDTAGAAELSKHHEDRLKGRVTTETDANRPLRYAIEVRHPSFENPEFIDLLRKHRIALVFADTAGKFPRGEDVTADFIYARLHGDQELYASGYTPAALDRWAERLKQWSTGKEPADPLRWSEKLPPKATLRDVFVYFDNDVKVRSPFDAMSLAARFGPTAQGVETAGNPATGAEPIPTKRALAEQVRSNWPAVTKRRAPRKRSNGS